MVFGYCLESKPCTQTGTEEKKHHRAKILLANKMHRIQHPTEKYNFLGFSTRRLLPSSPLSPYVYVHFITSDERGAKTKFWGETKSPQTNRAECVLLSSI